MDHEPAAPKMIPLVAPDVGCAWARVSLWLVEEGAAVAEGDRVVELVAGGATIDLEAPVTGRLAVQCIDEDAPVAPGAVLAEFEAAP